MSYPECLEPTRVEEYYEEDRKYSPVIERLIARTDLSKARNRYTLTHTHTHTDRNPIPNPDKKYSLVIERLIARTDLGKARNRYTLTHTVTNTHTHTYRQKPYP